MDFFEFGLGVAAGTAVFFIALEITPKKHRLKAAWFLMAVGLITGGWLFFTGDWQL